MRRLVLLLALSAVLSLGPGLAAGEPPPATTGPESAEPYMETRTAFDDETTGLVRDEVGVLSPFERTALKRRTLRIRQENGAEFVVNIMGSLGTRSIEEAARQRASRWGLGGPNGSKALVLLLALEDRKSRLYVAPGLSHAVTDADAQIILDNMRPLLRQDEPGKALLNAVGALKRCLDGQHPAARTAGDTLIDAIPYLFGVLVIVSLVILPRRPAQGRNRNRSSRDSFGSRTRSSSSSWSSSGSSSSSGGGASSSW